MIPALLLAALCGPADRQLTELSVFPAEVALTTSGDRQSLVVQARYADGVTEDVTAQAQMTLADDKLVKRDGSVLHPVADGATELTVTHAGKTVEVPVTVEKAAEQRPISFRLDVMPVFTKAGCNTGSCHGAARGKNGFRLSLFGFDPDGDHFRLTREMPDRRIDLSLPEECLLVEKAGGAVSHGGGKRLEDGSEMKQTVMRWLAAGAPNDDPKTLPTVAGIEIMPKQAVLEGDKATQKFTVRASYSDGTSRDVTRLAAFMSNNDTSAAIDDAGLVTAGARGEAFVMARFGEYTVGSQVIVIPAGIDYRFPDLPEHNFIDTLVHDKLQKLRILPSEVCSDEVFLRRVYLDLVGMTPTPEEYGAFVASDAPDKRTQVVDELLGRKEFVEIWTMKWAELLQIRSINNQLDYKAVVLYFNWLKDKLAGDVPVNVWVKELLASRGGTFKEPSTNFYQVELDNKKLTENVAQVFIGTRIQCAQCHNHPFDRWTMDDYYSLSAFFVQIGRKRAEDPREQIVFNKGGGEVKHPVGGRTMPPRFLGGALADVKGKDRREVFAEWLTAPENPYFARNVANITWAHFFGMGIVDPVDDVRVSNPASNPELLDALGKTFVESGFDFKNLVRAICTSRTYQRSTRTNPTNESDATNFSHGPIRRIRAEVLLDVISQVTETPNKFRGLPKGARAVQIADGQTSTYFLTTFGRATRETVCSCEVKMEPNLSQALHLINGDTTTQRIQQGKLVETLLKEGKTPEQVIETLYVRALSRKPTADEQARFAEALKDQKDAKPILEDVFWAVLNSKEFMFNH